MWFTRVSLRNPVFATMVMLALLVLGLFAFQRLKVDQFPNIDFPVVVVTTEYPGASPEIVESEVTKKVEEAVNAIAGVNALTSRSYEGQSVVIIEFQLHIDGRKAAEDVREKIAILKPSFRTEVKEPRVLRFDPASRAIWSVAVLPEAVNGKALSAVELTTWAEQVLKKRLENVRGVGSVTLVGGTRRADQHPPRPGRDGGAGRHRRPDHDGGAQREPGPAGGHAQDQRARARGAGALAPEEPAGLRPDHRRAARRQPRAPGRRWRA